MFARKLMRIVGLALLLMVFVLAAGACALAEDEPVDFSIQVSPESLTAPGEVTVSLRVSNPTNTDMMYPVTLLDPNGSAVPSFGDGGSYVLRSGESKSWEGKWNVTQEQLDAGSFSYTLRYHFEDETGALVESNRQATARIAYIGERVKLTVTRTITPEVVRRDKQATVVYELYNSGNVALSDIRVKENISKTAQTVKSLPAGERATLTFTSRMPNSDLKSSAAITYKAEGSTRTLNEQVDEAVIPLARPDLSLELSAASSGVNINEPATLLITFVNKGNISYSNVTVTEAKKGEILTNVSIPAGQTVTESKEFILTEPTTFKVTANLPDNTGETNTMTSKEVKVGVFDPEKAVLLTLTMTADQETVPSLPAELTFHVTVTNNSNIKAEKILLKHGDTSIYTIESLEPGESVSLDRDVRISHAGKFQFTASMKDTMGNSVSFDSNVVQINYAMATYAPVTPAPATVAPPVLVTAAPVDPILSQGRDAMLTAAVALGTLFGCSLILFAVSTVIRQRQKSKSNAAYDHLDLAERRDYTEPADEDAADEPDEYIDEPEEEAAQAQPAEPETERMLPHERLINAQEEAPVQEEIQRADEEGGYRISRDQSHPVLTNAPAYTGAPVDAEEPAPVHETPVRRRRSQRAQRTVDGE